MNIRLLIWIVILILLYPIKVIAANTTESPKDDVADPPSIQLSNLESNPKYQLADIVIGKSLEQERIELEIEKKKIELAKKIKLNVKVKRIATDTTPIQALAYQMVVDKWGEDEWEAFDTLVRLESGWSVTATNRTSGAYGLGQALPASKMAPYGDDYRTNPETQLKWMLDYVSGRYKTPRKAVEFHKKSGWY